MSDDRGTLPARFLERRVSTGRTPGAVWWVERDSRVVSRGAIGHAALEPDPLPLTLDTPFDLASLTKPLCTALLLVLLEAEGQLDADSPVVEWVDEVRDSFVAKASLVELARHAAGFAPWRPLYLDADDRHGYLERLSRENAAVATGTTLYSDLGYILLGIAIERAAGESLDRIFDRRVAAPLGLPRMGFATDSRRFADAAATERGNAYERRLAGKAGGEHRWREEVIRGSVHDANAFGIGGVAGHAGLFGTVAEVALLAREILRPGRLPLTPAGRARLFVAPDGTGARSVGWVPASAARAAIGILPGAAPGHTGFTGTSVWLDPEREGIYILLTNRVHPEVREPGFDRVRRGFHRAARAVTRTGT